MLDDLLQYHSRPKPGEFVDAVMRAIGRQQRLRRRILLVCGLVGAVFGLLGACLMADSLMQISTQLFATDRVLLSGTVAVTLLAALAWLLHEEPGVWG